MKFDARWMRRRVVTLSVMLVGLFSLITVPAYAQGGEDALAAEVVRALDELKSTGTLSVQARENLKNHPEIAA